MKPSENTWVDQRTASRSVSSGFVRRLWWIIRIERYVYKNLRLFSSDPLKPRQVGRTLSGVSRDVWALIGPLKDLHSCPQTNSVTELCRWWEVMLLSGHSDWWSSAVVVDLLELSPTCTQDLSRREHWGGGAWSRLFLLPSWRAWYRQMRLFPSHLQSIEFTAEGGVCAPVRHETSWNTSTWLFEVKDDALRSCCFKAEIFSSQSEALNAPSQYISPSRILNSWRLSLSKAA